ncbi:MAG TPA: hypothetical protein VE689_04165, partial [Candidatus Udaeobacter sp.]|nr:hypothetical protein [Candidatus Udaeobacter sp.]
MRPHQFRGPYFGLVISVLLCSAHAYSQPKPPLVYDTREHILEDARKEGKLIVSPGFEESTTPHLID